MSKNIKYEEGTESLEIDGNESIIQHSRELATAKNEESASNSKSYPSKYEAILLTAKEGVAYEMKEWMGNYGNHPKSYENAVEHIESKLDRPLSCLETTWTVRQYVITLLKLWLEHSLGKAFEYLDNEKNDISGEMSTVLNQLDSLSSLEDFCFEINDETSPLRHWCDIDCQYLKLILEQKDIFTSTSRFTNIVDCYFKQFKTSYIERVFSQCLNDIVKDENHSEKHTKFIVDFNKFISNINEDKNLQDILEKEGFHQNYVMSENKTGQDLVKKLVEMFHCVDDESSKIPEWLQTLLLIANSLSENEWTRKLQVLTKETCKRFLLPKTEIEFKEEGGKQIISIKGVAIFVSKMIGKMKRLKDENPDVEEIKIVGLKSVHIDCDLDNEIWHGINVGIVTDKLIVDGVINDESTEISSGVCWDISGQNSEDDKPMGEPVQPGESGGNVHVVCNVIINGQKWTIVSDGADGSAAYKWTKENFEELFPSGRVKGTNRQEAMETVLETLHEILPRENRTQDEEIKPEHKDNFLIQGQSEDGSKITAIFYGEKNEHETLISVTRGNAGHGGYGGDITIECFGNSIEANKGPGIPYTGKAQTGRKPLMAIRMGVFEASGCDGKIGKVTCDVAYIHNSSTSSRGDFYGFEENRKIKIKLGVERKSKEDDNTKYIKYKVGYFGKNNQLFAKVSMMNCSSKDVPLNLINALKKKAVIRQSLVQHFDQIDERKQLTDSIQKRLSHPAVHRSNSIDEIIKEMENKVHQHHQLITQCQQQQVDKIEKEQYVKPASESSRSFPKPKIMGRRPVWNNVVSANCLDEWPTEEGTDSLLHCLFGQLNSEGKYMCKDTNKFRKLIDKHSREESQKRTLGLDELEMLAEILEIKIHVYERHGSSSFRYEKTVDSNNLENNEYFVLRESNGLWKKLSPNYNLNLFCKEFAPAADEQNCNPTYFEQLKHWIDKKDELISSVEKLNPQNKTPDKLSQLLLKRLNNLNNDAEQTEKLTSAISSLAEWVECYNTRNISPFFYLTIVELYEPGEWTREFLQLEIEERLETPWENEEERENWRKFMCENLSSHDRALSLFTKIATKTEANDVLFAFDLKKLLRMLTALEEEKFDLTGDVSQLSIINFFYKQSSKFWERKVDEWLKVNEQLTKKKKLEYVNLLLELEYKNENELIQDLTNDKKGMEYTRYNTFLPGDNSKSEPKSVEAIVDEIKKTDLKNHHEKALKKLVNENIITVSKLLREELQNDIEIMAEKLFKKQPENKKLETFLKKDKTVQDNSFHRQYTSKVKKQKSFFELYLEMYQHAKNEIPAHSIVHGIQFFFLTDFKTADISSFFSFVLKFPNVLSLLSNPNIMSLLPNPDESHASPNSNVFSSLLSNLNIIPSLLSDPGVLSSLLTNPCVSSLLSNPNVLISAFSNPDLLSMASNSNLFSSILSNSNILSSLLPDQNVLLSMLSNPNVSSILSMLSNPNVSSILSNPNISSILSLLLPDANRSLSPNPNLLSVLLHPKFAYMVSNPTMLNMGGVEWAVASLKIFLCMFDYAVELLTGDKLRDTQKIAILYLIDDTKHTKNERKKFAEVWTGEGKSLIVAGVAIAYAFSMKLQKPWPHEIDIITSNDHLAIRDSSLSVAQGGLKEIYEFFNITVSNNCSKSVEDRRKAYYMDVVYGTLANFQRDYLLDEFYNRGIRGDRPTVYALIDEVDCMLLDRGNNMLYLSHDIPGMEMLESLYVFIWERISDTSAEMIKSAVLYDLYGQTTEDDLKKFLAPLGQEEYERAVIWEQLIQKNVIDRQGRLLINEVSDITEEMIDYTPTNATLQKETLNSKIIHFLCSVVKRERHIHIPSHLLDFVDRHLETWLDNARRAMELKRDENYVIDHDRSDTNPDLNPQVIIIDPDTGTDQYSSQWDGALHQFLQLKEGCKLTLQSLKAVFISNATYIKKYDNIAGVSGTLGSQPEQDFLKRKYECEFMTLPTAFPKRFSLKPPKILKTKESWWKAIAQETRATIQENRSIVVFCRSIKEVYQVHKHLKSATQDLRDNNKRIHRYTRDYEKFEFENKPGLDVGNVIVATNLAGRGTDIKISKNLEANGGLHICLTYFPDNERVEGQAMGRAARKGEPGSGILILCEEQTDQEDRESGTSEEWGAEKMFFMKEIRNRQERERISRLEKDFNHTEGLEIFFEKYTANFSEKTIREKWEEVEYLRDHCIARQDDEVLLTLIHGSALDKWALFLDETDYDFKCFDLKHTKFEINLKDLIMTPARTISYAKHLATTKSEKIYTKKAADIFTKLIENSNDNFIYPAAFYYLTFILLAEMKQEREEKEKKNDEDHDEEQTLAALFRALRQTETILNDHIKMQESFSAIHQSGRQTADQTPSLCAVNGYKEQKENTKRILEYFLDSTINLKNEVDKITQYYQEHKCVISTTPEFSLDCIEQDLKSNNSSSELYVFQLAGFDHVIKERSNTNY